VRYAMAHMWCALALIASPTVAMAKDSAAGSVRVVRDYVDRARQGQDAGALVSRYASVGVIGVGTPYEHAEFVTYFSQCALVSITDAALVDGVREIASMGDLYYVVGSFVCRDGETEEPVARIGFGVQDRQITRIDLDPAIFLAHRDDAN